MSFSSASDTCMFHRKVVDKKGEIEYQNLRRISCNEEKINNDQNSWRGSIPVRWRKFSLDWIRSNGSLSTEMTPAKSFGQSFRMAIFFWSNIKHGKFCMIGKRKKAGSYYIPPTIMLLMGMWISLTKNPTNPIIKNPNPVALAILANSGRSLVEVNRKAWEIDSDGDDKSKWSMVWISGLKLKYLCGQVSCISSRGRQNPSQTWSMVQWGECLRPTFFVAPWVFRCYICETIKSYRLVMSEQEILDVDVVEVTVGRRSHSVRPGDGVHRVWCGVPPRIRLQASCSPSAIYPPLKGRTRFFIFLLKFSPLRRFGYGRSLESKFRNFGTKFPPFMNFIVLLVF